MCEDVKSINQRNGFNFFPQEIVFKMAQHLCLITVLLSGLAWHRAEQAPFPHSKVTYYFPVTTGTKWVYLWKRDNQKDSIVVEGIAAVKDGKDGAKIVTTGRFYDEEICKYRVYEVSERGLYFIENLVGRPLLNPICELKLPLKLGQTWPIIEAEKEKDTLKTTLTAHGPEKINVPAGEFDCIRVEYRDNRSPEPTQTRWYALGIGEVRVKSDDLLIELKSFTPGK